MGDPNCYTCDYCLENCTACPNGNITRLSNGQVDAVPGGLYTVKQGLSVLNSRKKRIWNQSRMSSSQGLLKRKTMMVSKQVGQGACPTALGEAGGPGDLQSAIQKSGSTYATGRVACYNMGHLRNRVAYRNNVGVDRKHDSYQRYLARRVGGVFRKEKMPNIVGRTSWRGQPRTRTGSKACCKRPTRPIICDRIYQHATFTVGGTNTTTNRWYGWILLNGFLSQGPPKGIAEATLTGCFFKDLTTFVWNTYHDSFNINFGEDAALAKVFTSITIRDHFGNSITYYKKDALYSSAHSPYTGYTWGYNAAPPSPGAKPNWVQVGTVLEVSVTGSNNEIPCCENRIPNCTEQSKFTGTGKTRNANGELVGPGNVKNRTCVALRCQCPNCP